MSREIDARIAEEVMGWDSQVQEFDRFIRVGRRVTRYSDWMPSTDLNACFEAQAKCIERYGERLWADMLMCEVDRDMDCFDQADVAAKASTATAEQRCLAMLKCVEGAK